MEVVQSHVLTLRVRFSAAVPQDINWELMKDHAIELKWR